MDRPGPLELGRDSRRLRVETLWRLRWLAVAGQGGAVVAARFAFGFPLPLWSCLGVVAALAAFNLALRFTYPMQARLGDDAAMAVLAFDVLQLAALLFLTGGLQNPFALLFLAPVMISATALPPARTLALLALTVAATSTLAFRHLPLPWFRGETVTLPFEYALGAWASIVVGAAFVAVYATRVASEARDLADALAAAELVLAREQHLSQLDGLAAAAAHELGTPLATIALVSKELSRACEGGAQADDLALLSTEVARCRAILGKLSSLGAQDSGPLATITIGHLVEEAVAPHRHFGVEIAVVERGDGPEPARRRNAALLYGLGNIVENAVDFARTKVTVTATWDARTVSLVVADDGPGFAPDILARIGEPYVTTRPAAERGGEADDHGLGLGLFIALRMLERGGGKVSVRNAITPRTGARITVEFPRSAFERDDKSRAPAHRPAAEGLAPAPIAATSTR